jgi:hypothetical protein
MTLLGSMSTAHYLAVIALLYVGLVVAACLTVAIAGERERRRRAQLVARRPVAPLVPLDLARARRERRGRDRTRGVA